MKLAKHSPVEIQGKEGKIRIIGRYLLLAEKGVAITKEGLSTDFLRGFKVRRRPR